MNKKIFEISYSLRQQRNRQTRTAVLVVLAFFVIMNILLTKIITPVRQKAVSMEPNIKSGTFVLSTPLGKKIKRGEIVIISGNSENLSFFKRTADGILRALTFQKFRYFSEEENIMRRAVAVPGDTIFMKDFVLYIQPKNERHFFTEFELNQIPYSVDITVPPVEWNTRIGVRGNFDKITLGENEYFVLGDNRLACIDSRIFGKIKGDNIKKRVLLCYFPFTEFHLFKSKN